MQCSRGQRPCFRTRWSDGRSTNGKAQSDAAWLEPGDGVDKRWLPEPGFLPTTSKCCARLCRGLVSQCNLHSLVVLSSRDRAYHDSLHYKSTRSIGSTRHFGAGFSGFMSSLREQVLHALIHLFGCVLGCTEAWDKPDRCSIDPTSKLEF